MFCGSVIFGRGLYINCILTMHTNLCGSHEGSSFMSAVCHKECIVCNSLVDVEPIHVYDLTKNIWDVVLRGASFRKKNQTNDNQGNWK